MVSATDVAAAATAGVQSVHASLLAQAMDLLASKTADVDNLEEAMDAARTGFARLPWAACGPDGERRLNRAGFSVRCLTDPDGSVPETTDGDDLCAIVARAY